MPRGRPSKQAAPAAGSSEEDPSSDVPVQTPMTESRDGEPVMKKPRGRPPKIEGKRSAVTPKAKTPKVKGNPMTSIADGVEYNTVAREWRLKWTADEEKSSLVHAQKAFDTLSDEIKGVHGVKNIQRVVCGSCNDFKVIISLPKTKFSEWEAANFSPEEKFISTVSAIPGVTNVETQTYTLMSML
eukprot:gene1868-3623_t